MAENQPAKDCRAEAEREGGDSHEEAAVLEELFQNAGGHQGAAEDNVAVQQEEDADGEQGLCQDEGGGAPARPDLFCSGR